MNTLTSMKCAVVLLPALAMGIPMANAGGEKCDCPCDAEQTAAAFDSELDYSDREYQRADERPDQRQETIPPAKPAAASVNSSANETTHSQFLATLPAHGYHSDSLVGHEVVNRNNEETVGEVSDLVLDEDGQVVAVIISVGGVMGLGERDVAISWDQIERTVDGDEITLSVDLTEESLNDAPKYSNAQKLSRK